MSRTPRKVLAKIREAKEKQLNELDLSAADMFVSKDDPVETLTEFPIEILELDQLASLILRHHRIEAIPESLSQIPLTKLDLTDNNLKEFPKCIRELQDLTALSLNANFLREVPDWISELQNLTALFLGFNNLYTLPSSIAQLQNLNSLELGGNELKKIPEWIQDLQKLTLLNLSHCHLTSVPLELYKLQNLTYLHLPGNQLRSMPEWITRLHSLMILFLGSNAFNEIPDVIYDLTSLEILDFSNYSFMGWKNKRSAKYENRITRIDKRILNLPNLRFLGLPSIRAMEFPPPEVFEPIERHGFQNRLDNEGINRIHDYFRQLEAEGMDHLYEAKFLIVGEPGAGKTTLAKKIEYPEYELREEISTKGIDVIKWAFPMPNGQPFRVNIWDFGGQEIYHATHQFFLTKRSLYALVADTRKEDTDFYYWLNVVELLSDNSPLLIIKNEKQDRHREINERQLRGRFTNLEGTLSTNLATNRGLDEILTEIQHLIVSLPQVGAPLPSTWVKVREALEKDPRNYISREEYLNICGQNGFQLLKDKLQLSEFLHDLGVCLHFQADPLLNKTVILKPKWGTDGVYRVLDNPNVIRNLGRFTKDDLDDIWSDQEYADMQNELLRLMINFKLCYEIPGSPGTYIAPQLLTENQPEYAWDEVDNLILRYKYEFMPKGIITRFIVVMHNFIADGGCVWRGGVIVERDDTKAEVVEYYDHREIRIRVVGKHKKELLTIVVYELDKIHQSYNRLKYDKLIPCNCKTCKNSQNPYFYPFEVLQRFAADGQDQIQCQQSYEMVNVLRLVDDVIERSQFVQYEERAGGGVQFNAPVGSVVVQQSESGDNIMDENRSEDTVRLDSAWANGSFYLFAFVVVLAVLAVVTNIIPFYALVVVLAAGLLFVVLIGVLQLYQDKRLTEKSFMKLTVMVIEQLPILGQLAKLFRPGK